MTERIIVYHDNCHDGITALWVAKQKWPDAEVYPGKHGEPPDLDRLRGRDVVIVDFSWKRPEMLRVIVVAASVTVYDHHESAQRELDGVDERNIYIVFDMERSGAGITWDELFPDRERPPLLDYVEDRDLWRFALPGTREIHAATGVYPLTLEARAELMLDNVEELREQGAIVLMYHDRLVKEAAKNALRMDIGGHNVPAVACPLMALVSDIGHALCEGEPFAVVWHDRPDGTRYHSLRSTDEGLNVSEIATQLGGGGHRNAAGFITQTPGDYSVDTA